MLVTCTPKVRFLYIKIITKKKDFPFMYNPNCVASSFHVTVPKSELRFKTLVIGVLSLGVSGHIFIRTKERAEVRIII